MATDDPSYNPELATGGAGVGDIEGVTAGAGLTGGGASGTVTLNAIANADGSIVVNANDIQVGVLASDAQHGNRGGGAIHAVSTASAAGFQSADGFKAALNHKQACVTSTTADITLSGEQTLDGVLTSTSRVLVKAQTAGAENGIYVTAAGAWARATDMDASAETLGGTLVPVSSGTLGGNKIWMLTTDDPITLGTTALTFTDVTAGASGAPTDATYIVQTANGSLSAEQALGALATGILKNTTTTGVLSIAAAGTDYVPGPVRVTLAAAAQTITATIVGTPRRIMGTFRVKNNTGSNLSVVPLVNGVSTNLAYNVISQTAGGTPAGSAAVAWQCGSSAWVSGRFEMYIGVGGSAAQRVMVGHMGGNFDTSTMLHQVFVVRYADTSTTITSIAFDSQVANGFAIGSEIDITEIN